MRVPFNTPTRVANEFDAIRKAYDSHRISGDGPFGSMAESLLQEQLASNRVLLTTSCTHALEMTAILLDLQAGDEIIVPSFTFVTTALAFVMHGARPVFADIRPDTLNIDETQIEKLITPKTRAVVVVHYAGVGCEMDQIRAICETNQIMLIEDNAHGLGGSYRGRPLGSIGALATQSFHETKNFTCGEGGALAVNDAAYVERAEIIREKGTDRSRFFRGQVDKYSWIDKGSSYVISDLLAAMLQVQLGAREEIQLARERIWRTYCDELIDWAQKNEVGLPRVPAHCDQAYHMFYLLMPDELSRDALIAHLANLDISAVFHYLPLNRSRMGTALGGAKFPCPVSEEVSAKLVRLPFFTNMTAEQQEYVLDGVRRFRFAGHSRAG